MKINGLNLPDSFLSAAREGIFHREVGSWPLKRNVDAFGNPLETELSEVYGSKERILEATAELGADWKPDGYYGESGEEENEPGFIPDITDFSKVVCFGMSGDGAPFCFDFRDSEESPSVIWWADAYWKRIAPDFETFVGLFDLSGDA